MKRLFGTDGIRGVAGKSPLDRPSVLRFGAALARVLGDEYERSCRVVLGRDTRESGPWLRDAVVAGLASRGASSVDAGVITTPGLAHLLRADGFDAAVMISASHNPYEDNGLKAFDRTGVKLPDSLEQRVEELMLDGEATQAEPAAAAVAEDPSLVGRYVEFLEGLIPSPGRLSGLKLILDCANGSACEIAPEVFRSHGAAVETIGVAPDGRNINRDCGSLHLDALGRAVARGDADLGLAFDGDADRVLAVDRSGRAVDGDHILYVTARHLKREGRLRGDAVVATIMSNLWLEKRLEREGIALHRAPVGDKYVLERMLAEDLVLGGEQSGHVIFRDHATTGDGILTGLLLLDALLDGAEPLEKVMDGIVPFPQVQLNVKVGSKPDLRRHPRIGPAVSEAEERLAGQGRVVLRYSGTEPLARVMVEGLDPDVVRGQAERLTRVIEEELGG